MSLCMCLMPTSLPIMFLLQARRIWEAVLYAQPKVRTDAGLASLALLVRTMLTLSVAGLKSCEVP